MRSYESPPSTRPSLQDQPSPASDGKFLTVTALSTLTRHSLQALRPRHRRPPACRDARGPAPAASPGSRPRTPDAAPGNDASTPGSAPPSSAAHASGSRDTPDRCAASLLANDGAAPADTLPRSSSVAAALARAARKHVHTTRSVSSPSLHSRTSGPTKGLTMARQREREEMAAADDENRPDPETSRLGQEDEQTKRWVRSDEPRWVKSGERQSAGEEATSWLLLQQAERPTACPAQVT